MQKTLPEIDYIVGRLNMALSEFKSKTVSGRKEKGLSDFEISLYTAAFWEGSDATIKAQGGKP